MQTDHIHYLTVLDDTRSIHRAAHLLNLTPSYLSRVLKNAETELGTTLFTRSHEGLQPVEGSEKVLQDLRKMDQIYRNIGVPQTDETEISGDFIFYCRSALNTQAAPKLFRKLAKTFPLISIQYQELNEQKIIEAVGKTPHSVGLIIKLGDDPEPDLPDTVHIINNIVVTRLAALVSENHPLAKNRSISLARVLQSDLIFYDSYRDIESNNIFQYLCRRGNPHIKYCINSLVTFMAMLKEENCLTLVDLNGKFDKDMKVLPLQENIGMSYSLIYNAEDEHSPVIQFFIKTITQLLTQA